MPKLAAAASLAAAFHPAYDNAMTPLALIAALSAAASPACPIDRTVYQLQGAPEFTAGFARQDARISMYSDLAFWLRTPRRTYWFSLGTPNGYGGVYIAPAVEPRIAERSLAEDAPPRAEPEGDPLNIPFDAFRADMSAFATPPRHSDPAPAFLFARGIGPALWYDWTRLANGDPDAEQESMPIGLFLPARCETEPR